MPTLAEALIALDARLESGELTGPDHLAAVEDQLSAPPAPGRWIRGTFDGHLHGDPEVEGVWKNPGLTDTPTLRLGPLAGVVSDAILIDAPPAPTLHERPFLWERLEDAVILPPSGEPGTSLALLDLRLHDARILSKEDEPTGPALDRFRGRKDPYLRVQGTLYARLDTHQAWDPEPDPVAEIQAEISTDDLVHYVADPHEAGQPSALGITSEQAGKGCTFAAAGCLGVPFALGMLLALGALAGPWPAIAWAAVLVLATRGRHRLPEGWSGRRGCLASLGLLALHIALLGGFVLSLGEAPCAERAWWWLAALAIPVLACLALRSNLTLILAAGLWSFGAWIWSATPTGTCLAGVANRGALALSWQETADRYEESRAHDPDADLIEAATHQSAEPRISLDSALRKLEPWQRNCRLPIHLSGDLLFAPDSGTLRPQASPHLRRLARLLRDHPDLRARIEGHEATGDDALLASSRSQLRATAVATWLSTSGGIDSERLKTVGKGSAHPIVQDTKLSQYNRRIDVYRHCDGL